MSSLDRRTLVMVFVFILVGSVHGQSLRTCSTSGMRKPKFHLVSVSKGTALLLQISMKPKEQNDENLRLVGNYLNRKYCKDQEIIAQIFDNAEDAKSFTVYQVRNVPDTERAVYYLNRNQQEKLVRVKVVDGKQIETSIIMQVF